MAMTTTDTDTDAIGIPQEPIPPPGLTRRQLRDWRRAHIVQIRNAQRVELLQSLPPTPTPIDADPLTREETARILSAIARDTSAQARDRVSAAQSLIHLSGWRPAPEPPVVTRRVGAHDVPVAASAALADAMREVERLRSLADPAATAGYASDSEDAT